MAIISKVSVAVLVAIINGYRYLISGFLGNCCRFEPSCSMYAMAVIRAHGCWRGGFLAIWRLLRCHPWSVGGVDPVHEHSPSPACGRGCPKGGRG
jgi:hypothetical protein